jgi:putative transcriptional regulator
MKNRIIKSGSLLISEPFLGDPHFNRSVIVICEHNEMQGSFGLVLNQTSKHLLADVMEDNIYPDIPLGTGGPVGQNTLHFLHRRPDLIEGGIEITKGVFWGGNFQKVKELLNNSALLPKDIRCFIGYSGWSAGQLTEELKKDSWYIGKADSDTIFEIPTNGLWRSVLKNMGGDFKVIANYPVDPSLN